MSKIAEEKVRPCIRIKLNSKIEETIRNITSDRSMRIVRNSYSKIPREQWPLVVEELINRYH